VSRKRGSLCRGNCRHFYSHPTTLVSLLPCPARLICHVLLQDLLGLCRQVSRSIKQTYQNIAYRHNHAGSIVAQNPCGRRAAVCGPWSMVCGLRISGVSGLSWNKAAETDLYKVSTIVIPSGVSVAEPAEASERGIFLLHQGKDYSSKTRRNDTVTLNL
jgi:hypothetical protein